MFGRNLKITFATLGFILFAVPALADAIDGDWCHQPSGRRISIRGPQIVTPGGKHMEGDYSRHWFNYVVPAPEPGAGQTVFMTLFDENTVNELRSRARNALLVQEIASEEKVEGVDPDLLGLEGMDSQIAAKLAEAGVKTRDDLADLATDDLIEICAMDAEQAKALIMKAREHWFAEEEGK